MMGFMRQTDCAEAINWGWGPTNSAASCGLGYGRRPRVGLVPARRVRVVPQAVNRFVGVAPVRAVRTSLVPNISRSRFDGDYEREF